MVFQSYALYPHLSVRQTGVPLSFAGVSRTTSGHRPAGRREPAAQRVAWTRPAALSGGQRQRVAWLGHWSAGRGSSCWTSPCRTSMPAARRMRADSSAAPATRHHDPLRHPRPDRGHDDGPADRRVKDGCCRSWTRPSRSGTRPANAFVRQLRGQSAHEHPLAGPWREIRRNTSCRRGRARPASRPDAALVRGLSLDSVLLGVGPRICAQTRRSRSPRRSASSSQSVASGV